MKTLEQQISELAKKHAVNEGDNGNAELSFTLGAEASSAIWRESVKELVEAVQGVIEFNDGERDKCPSLKEYWAVN